MFFCQSVALAGQKAPRRSSSLVGRCQDVTRAVRSDAVRAVSRYGDCCGVQKGAGEASVQVQRLPRPKASDTSSECSSSAFDTHSVHSSEPCREDDLVCDGGLRLEVLVARAVGLPKADFLGTADAYVDVRLVAGDPVVPAEAKTGKGKKKKGKSGGSNNVGLEERTLAAAKTKVVRGTLSPQWDERISFEVPESENLGDLYLFCRLFDYDLVTSDQCLGQVSVRVLDAMAAGKKLSPGWQALLRQSPEASDRLAVLLDRRLPALPPQAVAVAPVQGKEQKFDLSKTQLVLQVNVHMAGAQQLLGPAAGSKRGLSRPGGSSTPGTPSSVASSAAGEAAAAAMRFNSRPLTALDDADLVRAAAEGQAPQCFRLLCAGVSVNARARHDDEPDCTPLLAACTQGRRDLVVALVDAFDASLVLACADGRSAAMCACEAGDEALAEWLIKEGVPADLRDARGRTVLAYAASHALPHLTAGLLAKQHVIVDDIAEDGTTPLLLACSSSLPAGTSIVQQLLEAKASANHSDKSRNTPLHYACMAGNESTVGLLLEHGQARGCIVNAKGETPMQLARAGDLPQVIVERLSQEGAPEAPEVQQVGETSEDAERRMLRARQAEVTEDQWRTWRALHPRRVPSPDAGGTVGDAAAVGGRGAGGGREASPPSASGGGLRGGVGGARGSGPRGSGSPGMLWRPGGGHAKASGIVSVGPVAAERPPVPAGRVGRLKAWASGLAGRRSSTSPGEEDSDLEFESYSARASRT